MWPFCGPEGRFDCSESVFLAARAALLSVRASEHFVCTENLLLGINPDCRTPAVVSLLADSAACLHHSTPLLTLIIK